MKLEAEAIYHRIVGENAIMASRVEALEAIDEEFLRWAARYSLRAQRIYEEVYQEERATNET